MTVRAHELAFRESFKDESTAPLPNLGADLAELDAAWEVIPLHGFGRKTPPQSVQALSVFISRIHAARPFCQASFFSAQRRWFRKL